jgi:hypothetical protein
MATSDHLRSSRNKNIKETIVTKNQLRRMNLDRITAVCKVKNLRDRQVTTLISQDKVHNKVSITTSKGNPLESGQEMN